MLSALTREGTVERIQRTYSELLTFPDFHSRLKYLLAPFQDDFGALRFLNQQFYSSGEWRRTRRDVITRDNGCELALPGVPVCGEVVVHHMVPILPVDFTSNSISDYLLDPEYLITCSRETHELIHGRGREFLLTPSGERRPGDTKAW